MRLESEVDRSTAPSSGGHLHRIAPLLILTVGVGALIGAVGLSLGELTAPGAGLWPFIVAMLLTGTALVLIAVDHRSDYESWTGGTVRIVGGVAGLGVFIVAFEAIGFLVPAFLLLLCWLRVFARESWRWSLGLAVTGSVGMYLLFDRVLGVPFPDGVVAVLVGG